MDISLNLLSKKFNNEFSKSKIKIILKEAGYFQERIILF